jgi:N utilization substance protein B
MSTRRHERTYARKQAIQLLYQADIRDVRPTSLLQHEESFIDGALPSKYALRVVEGIEGTRVAIDHLLGEYAENWTVDRMPTVDRAILRLACYEMVFVDEVPVSVSINEAVDLAKEFGGEDDSPRFVNGVLGRIADYLEEHGGSIPGYPREKPQAAPVDSAADAAGGPAETAEAAEDAADDAEAAEESGRA